MLTDFSGWTVHCESEPGRVCSEEKCNYVAILFIFICITHNLNKIIATRTIIFNILYSYSGCDPSIEKQLYSYWVLAYKHLR